ncbi:MAG: DUF4405 domain-containing protein [Nanoarchaeota archaeon]|nr:DUF4405 domain-containing protein [Nanoarchaeota archaeon]
MDLIKLRGITSTALIVVFALVVFTGIGMYFAPSGRVAYEAGWTFFGIQKFQLENLHTITGFLMAVIVGIHLLLNYKMYAGEVKMLFK